MTDQTQETSFAATVQQELFRAGAAMANICFNLSFDARLDERTRLTAQTARKEWDQANKEFLLHAPTPYSAIKRIADVASAVGWQAGEPALEAAGHIVSVLAIHPEHVDRFLAEGAELFIDGTFKPENGSLTYRSIGGDILSPTVLRKTQGSAQ